MRVFHGFPSASLILPCALTIGSFDGVHRGHQAMLALLREEAKSRGLKTTVLSFEPHPRDYFAQLKGWPSAGRVMSLRDKLLALQACAVDQVLVMRFDAALAALQGPDFVQRILVETLHCAHVLVGDDFRFGAQRGGDLALLRSMGAQQGFTVECMPSYLVGQERVSSSNLRLALAQGDLALAQTLLGRAYRISGHVIHGRKLGRTLGFPTLNLGFHAGVPAARGIFVCQVHGLAPAPLPAVASLGVRPTVEDQGRVLLEVHCLAWPSAMAGDQAYGKIVQVDLLQKLRDEARYDGLEALTRAISRDVDQARAYFAAPGS